MTTLLRGCLVPFVLMLTPLMWPGAAPAARAQEITRVPQIAVLDFVYESDPTGGILARQASDAVVVELTRRGRFDVIPRAQVDAQLREMGLASRLLDTTDVQRLGQALGADYVATGRVADLAYGSRTERLQAALSVLFADVASGEYANGAFVRGSARVPAYAPADVAQAGLLRAFESAAFQAAETIDNYDLPEATVLITRGNTEVTLNRGGRGGITVGQEFVILRGDQRVGRVRVISVGSQDALAVITDTGKGIRPSDRARAVFELAN